MTTKDLMKKKKSNYEKLVTFDIFNHSHT